MELKKFEVQGKIKSDKMEKKFSKIIDSINENTAIDKVLGLFGSKNRIKRRDIEINEVKEVKKTV
jgi:ribosomal protein L20A (L18A)